VVVLVALTHQAVELVVLVAVVILVLVLILLEVLELQIQVAVAVVVGQVVLIKMVALVVQAS
jgi:hypothetical protein